MHPRQISTNIRNIYESFNKPELTMGLVKISDPMHDNLRTASDALSRSINAQAEHWMRIGMLSELYPTLTYADICQLLLRDAQAGAVATWQQHAPANAPAARAVRKAAA